MSSGSDCESSASDGRKPEGEITSRDGRQSSAQEISAEEQARRRAAIEEILAWQHEGHRY